MQMQSEGKDVGNLIQGTPDRLQEIFDKAKKKGLADTAIIYTPGFKKKPRGISRKAWKQYKKGQR